MFDLSVGEAMHAGVLACPPETPLRTVARMMVHHRIHSLVILGDPGKYQDGRPWAVVSDLDLIRALGSDIKRKTAGDVAVSPIFTVAPDDQLEIAVELMGEHAVSHLVVVDPATDKPVGILSTLDIASVVGLHRAFSATP
jgi:CBS domain-containing protein